MTDALKQIDHKYAILALVFNKKTMSSLYSEILKEMYIYRDFTLLE